MSRTTVQASPLLSRTWYTYSVLIVSTSSVHLAKYCLPESRSWAVRCLTNSVSIKASNTSLKCCRRLIGRQFGGQKVLQISLKQELYKLKSRKQRGHSCRVKRVLEPPTRHISLGWWLGYSHLRPALWQSNLKMISETSLIYLTLSRVSVLLGKSGVGTLKESRVEKKEIKKFLFKEIKW